MRKDVDELIHNLNVIKDDIINSINISGSDTNRELSQKLLKLSAKDTNNAELYQIISFLNSNIDTDNIKFKKKVIEIVNKIITIKIEGLQILKSISESLEKYNNKNTNKDTNSTPGLKIPYIGLIKIKDIVLFLSITFIILFLAYKKDPITTTRTISTLKSMNVKVQHNQYLKRSNNE